jgi:hypothetical protein
MLQIAPHTIESIRRRTFARFPSCTASMSPLRQRALIHRLLRSAALVGDVDVFQETTADAFLEAGRGLSDWQTESLHELGRLLCQEITREVFPDPAA